MAMVRIRTLEPASPAGEAPRTPDHGDLALVLTGGGARAAYQVGILRYMAHRWPDLQIPILTGISAGAMNAVHLAAHHGGFPAAVEELSALWQELSAERVFRIDARSLAANAGRWGYTLLTGDAVPEPRVRGLVDTSPLRELLCEALHTVDGEITGIDYNLKRGALRAVALATTSYTTGKNVTWVQGRPFVTWDRPERRAIQTRLRVEHVLASGALPIFFPAVQIGEAWHGDGGVRLTAPLSPALHLGAHKILAVSTRSQAARGASAPVVAGYPPPAQVLGVLASAIFLDLLDQDAARMALFNRMLRRLPPHEREGRRIVELLVLRPSRELGKLAAAYEPRLPRAFRFMVRGLGTRRATRSEMLSMLMFQPDYLRRLMELGESDAGARASEIEAFLRPSTVEGESRRLEDR